jgi:hypothetical protein
MKRILLLVLLSGCSINRWVDRVEIPANQVWHVYTELHVIRVDSCRRYQRVTAIPYGKPYPKYAYQWVDYDRTVRVGDLLPLTDSLRSHIDYKRNWKKHPAK